MVVAVVGGGVWVCCVVSLLALRRGVWRIMRSICRCVRLSRFSRSPVIVQASLAYSTVGVIVPWNSRRRSDRQHLGPVSSCFRAKNFFHAVEMRFSISVLCGSPKFRFSSQVLGVTMCGQDFHRHVVNGCVVGYASALCRAVVVVEDFCFVWV